MLTEQQIEQHVERQTDKIDAAYMRGSLTHEQYHAKMRDLTEWADVQYAKRKLGKALLGSFMRNDA